MVRVILVFKSETIKKQKNNIPARRVVLLVLMVKYTTVLSRPLCISYVLRSAGQGRLEQCMSILFFFQGLLFSHFLKG